MNSKLSSLIAAGLIICAVLWATPETVSGQIYVASTGVGTIGEYTTAGAPVNASLISGLNSPFGLAAR
jgi:hypothetical protein